MKKRNKAFTLAEMMVVMLILTVMLAAFAPLMTKRKAGSASESPWRYAVNNTDAYFGIGDNQTAMLGQRAKNANNTYEKQTKFIISSNEQTSPIVFKMNNQDGSFYTNLMVNHEAGSQLLGNFRFGGPYSTSPSGEANTAFGLSALKNVTSGNSNTAFGTNAVASNTTGAGNTAVGAMALPSNTTGVDNVALGASSLYSNTTGSRNIALGPSAGYATTTGNDLVAIGYNALKANTTGKENVAIGSNALGANTNADWNTAIGYNSLASTTTGEYNTAVGAAALKNNKIGEDNVAVGDSALVNNTSGDDNVAVGTQAAYKITTGKDNVAIGGHTLKTNQTGSGNTAIGDSACYYVTGSNKTCVGAGSGPSASVTVALDDSNVVYLGTSDSTVYIPGNVVIGGSLQVNDTLYVSPSIDRARFVSASFGNSRASLGLSDDSIFWVKYTNTGSSGFVDYATKYSDKRLKNIKGENKSGLEKVRELKVFDFTFKNDDTKTPRVGVIAQDLKKIFPAAVTKDDNGFLKIRMEDMFYAVVNAVKQLDKLIQTLISEVKILELRVDEFIKKENAKDKKIKELEQRLERLEKLAL